MRDKLYYAGYNQGWKFGLAYATGTHADRASVARKIARMNDHYGQWSEGVKDGFSGLCNERAENIIAGRAPRTINPHRLATALKRIVA